MHFLKEGQKIWAWVDPPPSIIRAMPERKRFFQLMSSLNRSADVSLAPNNGKVMQVTHTYSE